MKRCFLCGHKGIRVLKFSDEAFEKCVSMLSFRHSKHFKYSDITLTHKLRRTVGHHKACYKKVCCLKHKYREEFNEFCKTQAEQLKSDIHGPEKRGRRKKKSALHTNDPSTFTEVQPNTSNVHEKERSW
ncbi:PREDICTED: uncharacterized protein LOC108783104 isoform X1 [Cyphomyrmex costatus]|uniref:uncharacterized protein LOC108783104 isoform X1 n=2 Tax=Cyphomyrmex costatus TaxID=456900 RepID=UPI000852306A|nr:PREDICTED: uncharacterized protein LOC108783104 isoform X1 [Cyphomyrmex costatus]